MAIATFSTVNDGLEPHQKDRGHHVVDVNLDASGPWVQMCRFTLRGHWRYLEHDWIAKPGTFIFEPAGEAHTVVVTDDSPEPAIIFFVVDGALVYLDKPVHGTMAAFEDGFSALELSRKFFRDTGLDVAHLDLRIR
jgi:hypothetical protein